jgi:hypothetical protein
MNQDPVLPVGSLILGWLLTFVVVAILATALVLLVRDRELSAMAKLGWAIAVVLVPIVGPAA